MGALAATVVVTLASACGRGAQPTMSVETSSEAAPAVETATPPRALSLPSQVADIPILRVIDVAPSEGLESLLGTADGFVVATIRSADLAPERVVSQMPVQCESSEGVPTEGRCISEHRVVSLVLSLDVEGEAWANGSLAREGLSQVTLPFATLSQPLEASRSSAADLVSSFSDAVSGERVAAFVSSDGDGGLVPTSGVALAAVASDGDLVPAPFFAFEASVGIGELTTVSELQERVLSQSRFEVTG